MTRRLFLPGLIFAIAAPAVLAQSTARSTTRGGDESAVEASKKPSVRAFLRQRVNVDWDEMSFEEVVDWLRDEGSINVVPRWPALNAEGVERDTPVTLRLRDATVANVLEETLDQLSDSGTVRYRGVEGTMTISTKTDFERKLHLRVYDVTDLLIDVPNYGQDAPNIDLQQVAQTSGGQGGGGQSIFSGSSGGGRDQSSNRDSEQIAEERQRRLDIMIDMIIQTIEFESWVDNGGRGSIIGYNQMLIIRNTIEVHEELAGAFALD